MSQPEVTMAEVNPKVEVNDEPGYLDLEKYLEDRTSRYRGSERWGTEKDKARQKELTEKLAREPLEVDELEELVKLQALESTKHSSYAHYFQKEAREFEDRTKILQGELQNRLINEAKVEQENTVRRDLRAEIDELNLRLDNLRMERELRQVDIRTPDRDKQVYGRYIPTAEEKNDVTNLLRMDLKPNFVSQLNSKLLDLWQFSDPDTPESLKQVTGSRLARDNGADMQAAYQEEVTNTMGNIPQMVSQEIEKYQFNDEDVLKGLEPPETEGNKNNSLAPDGEKLVKSYIGGKFYIDSENNNIDIRILLQAHATLVNAGSFTLPMAYRLFHRVITKKGAFKNVIDFCEKHKEPLRRLYVILLQQFEEEPDYLSIRNKLEAMVSTLQRKPLAAVLNDIITLCSTMHNERDSFNQKVYVITSAVSYMEKYLLAFYPADLVQDVRKRHDRMVVNQKLPPTDMACAMNLRSIALKAFQYHVPTPQAKLPSYMFNYERGDREKGHHHQHRERDHQKALNNYHKSRDVKPEYVQENHYYDGSVGPEPNDRHYGIDTQEDCNDFGGPESYAVDAVNLRPPQGNQNRFPPRPNADPYNNPGAKRPSQGFTGTVPKKPTSKPLDFGNDCYLCHGKDHWAQDCPIIIGEKPDFEQPPCGACGAFHPKKPNQSCPVAAYYARKRHHDRQHAAAPPAAARPSQQ